ncbi:1-(5-phosphoribosyl)-5-[(5-phosphoribosylamino)methylideneamino]imidazole-4-carboxamide isomerase [Helicobacter valdiviensis]|uniref:1-(5-phosphoribosyl)-5-[(5-phosphoribosylamino)methylideneamino] imidazole-4-carboxamide isomerase n=1 Tax=Helicobacter valdiviensis TaxID=1458358 RepID=A0A2W6MVE3_9HELI|nr:1-(5-phosphoribosyl)-5-[(5-phosphoribosylamino)methylideneamino]imidazole-4-carboxamide isomerase [Helicobacter valdiviensis]PZT48475.1 1-(5-phosphoribosyl)-5-[(5-phosphoribosylamino)methylideneamino]imidazole-4-carboxamide isomerase [Helicobacter valdiviensis]
MQIIPAIDLKEGNVVRLKQGDMESAKIYDKSPLEFAKLIEGMGAEILHIVDLDGAICGTPKNKEVILSITQNTNLKVEVGGGIRDEATIKEYLNIGVNRVILGSMALKNPTLAKTLAKDYPIIIGIDAKNGYVATQGWVESESILALEFAKEFKESKILGIICTDISCDGMLSGVNVDFTKGIKEASGHFVIASGGVSSLEDLERLQSEKIDGVIVGKAFYEGKIDLKEAFKKFA